MVKVRVTAIFDLDISGMNTVDLRDTLDDIEQELSKRRHTVAMVPAVECVKTAPARLAIRKYCEEFSRDVHTFTLNDLVEANGIGPFCSKSVVNEINDTLKRSGYTPNFKRFHLA